jgi:AcrR family transcriptional regulator
MTVMEIRTENKIFDAAYHTFLLYGFHGTTIQKIALKADVSKSSIHYYFRSKEKLYVLVVRSILDTIQETESEINFTIIEPFWSRPSTSYFQMIGMRN